MDPSLLSQAARAIQGARSVLIACHVRPDGDALGSLLALGLGCESLGKATRMVSPDGVPEAYRFLPHWERVSLDGAGEFDVAIGVDADGSSRLVVFSDQSPEKGANDTINLATHLGAGGGLNLDPAIFPAGDVDTYQLVAQETWMLDFHVFFELNAALPDNGNLDVDVLDANGNLIASGAASGDGQQVTIPAVKGQVYFLRVRGAGGGARVRSC